MLTPMAALFQHQQMARAIMDQADRHQRNGVLSVNELRTFLRGGEFGAFAEWLAPPGRRSTVWRQYDWDSDGGLDMTELTAAVGQYLEESAAEQQQQQGQVNAATCNVSRLFSPGCVAHTTMAASSRNRGRAARRREQAQHGRRSCCRQSPNCALRPCKSAPPTPNATRNWYCQNGSFDPEKSTAQILSISNAHQLMIRL